MSSMMTSPSDDLFDPIEGARLKKEGMTTAAEHRGSQLALGRKIARRLALEGGDRRCDADRVGRILKNKYGIDTLGPAAGSLFRGGDWEFTGVWKKSARTTNHSRMIRVWRLVGAG